MGSLRKKTATRQVPTGAELFTRRGERFVRWLDGHGKKKTAKLTTGRDGSDRIVTEAATYTAKYRSADGTIHEVATGCRDRQAAQSVLNGLERRAELVKANVITAGQDAVANHQATALAGHLDDYIRSLKAAGRSKRHIVDTKRQATQIAADCGFRSLGGIEATRVESWLANKLDADMASRTRNSYLQALNGFCGWCVRNDRQTRHLEAGTAHIRDVRSRNRASPRTSRHEAGSD